MSEQLDLLVTGVAAAPTITVTTARDRGEAAAKACAEKAREVSGFDLVGARRRALELLAELGPTSGEQLVYRLKADGFRGHDDRCFGPVFQVLARRNEIFCVRYCARQRGNGTAGGRIWSLTR